MLVYCGLLCAGLPSSVRSWSGQPCSPFEAGALPVLRPARRIHIRLRGRVLCNPPRLKGFRSAAAPTVTAHGTSGRVRRVASHLGLAPAPRDVSPGVFTALRAAMLRRRNTAFSPCDVYHRASAELHSDYDSLRLGDTIPHPCAVSPTFRYGAFSFVASALADLSSARLTTCDRSLSVNAVGAFRVAHAPDRFLGIANRSVIHPRIDDQTNQREAKSQKEYKKDS